jgi:hypothetical protein
VFWACGLLKIKILSVHEKESTPLTTRGNIALWTGSSGDIHEGLRLAKSLLPDQERVLGSDHPYTLRNRSNMAYWTHECGDAYEALRLFKALLPDQEHVLGLDHPDTRITQGWIDHLSPR